MTLDQRRATIEDVARVAGVSRAAVSKVLRDAYGVSPAMRERVNKAIASFIRLGWIEQHERRYSIRKRESLEIRAR